MDEELMQCPYDTYHRIRSQRYAFHLVKCRKNYLYRMRKENKTSEIHICMYNYEHHVKNIDQHKEQCPDAKNSRIAEENKNAEIKAKVEESDAKAKDDNAKENERQQQQIEDAIKVEDLKVLKGKQAKKVRKVPNRDLDFKEIWYDDDKNDVKVDNVDSDKILSPAEISQRSLQLYRCIKSRLCKQEQREIEWKLELMGAYQKIPPQYKQRRNVENERNFKTSVGFPGWTMEDGWGLDTHLEVQKRWWKY